VDRGARRGTDAIEPRPMNGTGRLDHARLVHTHRHNTPTPTHAPTLHPSLSPIPPAPLRGAIIAAVRPRSAVPRAYLHLAPGAGDLGLELCAAARGLRQAVAEPLPLGLLGVLVDLDLAAELRDGLATARDLLADAHKVPLLARVDAALLELLDEQLASVRDADELLVLRLEHRVVAPLALLVLADLLAQGPDFFRVPLDLARNLVVWRPAGKRDGVYIYIYIYCGG
jgi:hypothetical protein